MPDQREYVPCPFGLFQSFLIMMRGNSNGTSLVMGVDARHHKANYIITFITAIHSTNRMFGCDYRPGLVFGIKKFIATCKDEDDVIAATPFDMVADMNMAFEGLCTCSTWSAVFKVTAWAMFLVEIVSFARDSDITSYAPLVEDCRLPDQNGPGWDRDGKPKWVELEWLRWKSRSKTMRGRRYGIKIHRNYLDTRFCPMSWYLLFLNLTGLTTGPIFGDISASQHETSTLHTMRVFTNKPSCTKNYVRRSAAQWAGRSGDDGIGTRNNGRWASMHVMMRYVTQGCEQKEEFERNDPLFETWVWKPVTVKNAMCNDSL